MFDDHVGIETLSQVMSDYFTASSAKKEEIKLRFTRTQNEILNKAIATFGQNTGKLTQKLTSWDPFGNVSSPWFDPEWMFGVEEKFHIVIGNPPYVGEKGHRDIFMEIKNSPLGERFYLGKMDLFYFFFHCALDFLNDGGVMAYITTNYFITATGGAKLRRDMQERASILKLLNFGELKIFESALGQHNMISILMKGKLDIQAQTLVTKRKGYLGSNIVQTIIDGEDEKTDYYSLSQDDLYSGGNIKLTTGGLDNILDKIKVESTSLGELAIPRIGIKTALDRVFVLDSEKLEQLGIPKNSRFLRPWYKGSDISRYFSANETNKHVLYLHEPVMPDDPTVHKYIMDNQAKIRGRKDANLRGAYKKGYWWVLSTPRLEVDFEEEKIVTQYRTKRNEFTYNNIPWYASADVYFITNPKDGYDLKYLLGVLNSSTIYVWLYNRGKRKGDMLELYQEPLSLIPIPKITKENNEQVIEVEKLVDQILLIKKPDPRADTKDLEDQIDQIVYRLYELSPDEIKIIETSHV